VPQRKSRQAAAEEAFAGVWSSWGPWSSCSSSCGSGISQQSRRCLPREAGARGWAPSRPEEAGERWEAYPGRAVSALRRAYPLHVDLEAQPSTANRHALPLYGDARATAASQPGPGLYAPANSEPPSLPLYRRPANRGSVPLYRQERPPNHGRAGRGPAGGARGSTGWESGSAASPERAPNQSAAPQPRQRSVPSWRVTAGNRRSLNRQEVHLTNR
ncbi:hypothetical protein chiPu_0030370, partial [Chiloscyllium punctatum]|nr:hypothetical protein [Chiloscyllium punctatum]